MKICILTHTFPRFPGDTAAPFMDGVASGMVSAGNKVFVLTPFSQGFKNIRGKPYKLITYKYVFPDSLHLLGYSRVLKNDMGLKPVMTFLSPLMFFFGFINLFRLVRQEKIDLINAHWILPNGFIASLVSVLTGVPVVSTLPGSDVYMAKKNFFFRWMAKFATEVSRAVTSNSPQLIKDLKKITGVKKNKFFPIIYGVDPKEFKPVKKSPINVRAKYGISPKSVLVLGVGRLVEKKGFHFLVKAAGVIFKRNKDVSFLLAGEGDQRRELETLIKKNKLNGKFILAGSVDHDDLLYYFNAADIFILPSVRDREGNLDDQSVSVVEAMAVGLPVVTTDFPGYRLVIRDGDNGFLVPERRSDLIAKSLLRLVGSAGLRRNMGEKNRYLALTKFSWKAIGGDYTHLFVKLINRG